MCLPVERGGRARPSFRAERIDEAGTPGGAFGSRAGGTSSRNDPSTRRCVTVSNAADALRWRPEVRERRSNDDRFSLACHFWQNRPVSMCSGEDSGERFRRSGAVFVLLWPPSHSPPHLQIHIEEPYMCN